MNMDRSRTVGLVVTAALAAGALLYAAIASTLAYHTTLLQLQEILAAVGPGSLIRYGIVSEVDRDHMTLAVRFPNPYVPSGAALTLKVLVEPNTVVFKQELISDEHGVYYAVSPTTLANFSDIGVGTHVRINSIGGSDRSIKASVIVYGNPL